MGMSWT